jgi:hypothetical protein
VMRRICSRWNRISNSQVENMSIIIIYSRLNYLNSSLWLLGSLILFSILSTTCSMSLSPRIPSIHDVDADPRLNVYYIMLDKVQSFADGKYDLSRKDIENIYFEQRGDIGDILEEMGITKRGVSTGQSLIHFQDVADKQQSSFPKLDPPLDQDLQGSAEHPQQPPKQVSEDKYLLPQPTKRNSHLLPLVLSSLLHRIQPPCLLDPSRRRHHLHLPHSSLNLLMGLRMLLPYSISRLR